MRKSIFLSLMFCFLSVATANRLLSVNNSAQFENRAVSLKVLQQKLKGYRSKKKMPTNLLRFCGLTCIHGYVVDAMEQDIILIGSVDQQSPHLNLDDFVVALRNAWMKYTELRGNTRYYSNPGCSIEPDNWVLRKFEEVGKQMGDERQKLANMEKNVKQMEKICLSPQQVIVTGIPFDTHFARVMVQADYDMKRIVDGSDELNLLFFSSLMDMELEEVKKSIRRKTSMPLAGAMNRFWFFPGENRYLEDNGMVLIQTCKVKLLTEEEHLTSDGEVSGTGRANPIAKTFADDFSRFYSEIAAQRPIFRELENLFRFAALAKILKLKNPHLRVGLSLDYLLEHYPVSEKEVKRQLPGRFNVKKYERQKEHEGNVQVSKLWLPSCGGVEMAFNPGQKDFMMHHDKCILKKMSENTMAERSSPQQLSWDIGDSPNDKYYATVLLDSAGAYLQGHSAIDLYSPQDGHYYCSMSADEKDKLVKNFKDKDKFKKRIKRYNWGFRMEISRDQFERMKKTAEQTVNGYYDWQTYNCADFVRYILKSGNLNTGNRQVRPNDYICEVMENNEGTVFWNR